MTPVSRETAAEAQPAVLTGFIRRVHLRPNVADREGTPTLVCMAELEGGVICQLIMRADDADELAEALRRVGAVARTGLLIADRMPVTDNPQA
jgi:hypothetical protein